MPDDALPWWGLREPNSAPLVRWHWSTPHIGSVSLPGLDVVSHRSAGSGDRARRALLTLPALALPATSLAAFGAGAAARSGPVRLPASPAVSAPAVSVPAVSEAACLGDFGGTEQSLGLRAEGRTLSISVHYECRLANGSLRPLSGLPVAVHVTSPGHSSVLDAATDAEGWTAVFLTVPSGGPVSVVAEVPGFPAFANCRPTACLAQDPIRASLDLPEASGTTSGPSGQSSGSSSAGSAGPQGTATPLAQVSPPLSSDLGRLPSGRSHLARTEAAGSQASGTTPGTADGSAPTSHAPREAGVGRSAGAPATEQSSEQFPATGSVGTSSRPTSLASDGRSPTSASERANATPTGPEVTTAGANVGSAPVPVLPVATQERDGASPLGPLGRGAFVVALGACAAALAVLGQRWRTRQRLLGVAGGPAVPTTGFGAWDSIEIDEPPADEPPRPPADPPPSHAAGGTVDYWIPER